MGKRVKNDKHNTFVFGSFLSRFLHIFYVRIKISQSVRKANYFENICSFLIMPNFDPERTRPKTNKKRTNLMHITNYNSQPGENNNFQQISSYKDCNTIFHISNVKLSKVISTMFWILKSLNLVGNPSFWIILAYFLAASRDSSSDLAPVHTILPRLTTSYLGYTVHTILPRLTTSNI